MLIPALVLLLLAYTGFTVFRGYKIYQYLKSDQPGWQGKVLKTDTRLGYAPIPCSTGTQINPGFDTQVKFDSRGFRIPIGQDCARPLTRPLVLALGCSYTFGHGIDAEDTFPRQVAEALGGTELNAGMPAYGLAQMVLLAEKLIPEYQPDYVLVQFSSWLVGRATWPLSISYPGKVPQPYYAKTGKGEFFIQPPVFTARVFDLPIAEYRDGRKSAGNFFSFLGRAGITLLLHDDAANLMFDLRLVSHLIPAPARLKDQQELIDAAYRRIEELCRQNHAQMVVVMLYDPEATNTKLKLEDLSNAVVVDTWPALVRNLEEKNNEGYYRTYAHVAGNPPKLTDPHPNELANRIIASEIVKTLEAHSTGR